ncbi:phosphoribosyl-AMP cyclohydrolase [Kingella kingae]|nr:phosphoribosyl-AMP cyclohydrolase [Kingella kingae]MDK4643502.1 phosphoribosyl-AMP cyclohydrolase [Kingella kingae]MDK4645511.1 phosphoribosyl-AMP cyclohydrolase [Kingella kingae]MDK4663339.1 phosphoribosyl-AMP cyclohydrolase [Kingella kingae]MDK4669214.1 phosphoribosyl-AMP cyclohydrolase [Kingella kingae]MDK4675399.1 phosphoribosyl-AMP cyclohydrolase [Kingella kingae]
MNTLLNAVKWDKDGLVCSIAQDAKTQRVLMVAYMNAEALQQTAQTGFAHYYSRSRQKQWQKGEESGQMAKRRRIGSCTKSAGIAFGLRWRSP